MDRAGLDGALVVVREAAEARALELLDLRRSLHPDDLELGRCRPRQRAWWADEPGFPFGRGVAVRLEVDRAPEPVAQPQAVAAQPVAPAPAGLARFNVETLSSLVEQRWAEFPDRVDEWRWTIISLRDIADISGALPHTVDGLVRDVFEPILD